MASKTRPWRWASTLLPLASCTSWSPAPSPYPEAYPQSQQARIWTGTAYQQLHAIGTDSATISGVPFTQPSNCDSCRVATRLVLVDSVRLGNPDQAGMVLAAIPFVALFGLVLALRADIRGD